MKSIKITNARVHNLKNISLEIPKNTLTVITGLSGSGKSSLAFDTIYAEGQRRYAESLSAYARQFMDVQDKPDVDEIKGLSPTIAIDQKNISQNPRSTVGTTTEIYDFLRLLFSRIGVQYDPETNQAILKYTSGEIIEILRKISRTKALLLLSPLGSQSGASAKNMLAGLDATHCEFVRINDTKIKLSEAKKFVFDPSSNYSIDVILARLEGDNKRKIPIFVEKGLDLSNGSLMTLDEENGDEIFYRTFPFSSDSQKHFDPIEPRTFSFNSPYGACPRCTGLGFTLDVDPELVIPNPRLTLAEGAIQPWTRIVGNQSFYQKLLTQVAESHNFSEHTPVQELSDSALQILLYGTGRKNYTIDNKIVTFDGVVPNLLGRYMETDSEYIKKEIQEYMREKLCPVCLGKRLKRESLAVKIGDYSIGDLVQKSIEDALHFFEGEKKSGSPILGAIKSEHLTIAEPIIREIIVRLKNLIEVGLPYLTLDRSVTTISGGEAQRIRLSTQLSTGLTDVIYVLDEPSIGLHPKDNTKLIHTLKTLRDLGNTVIVVEHDEAMIEAADFVVDIGPGAGTYGGEIMAMGTAEAIKKSKNSLTGAYMSGKERIEMPKKFRSGSGKKIQIIGATANNLKNVSISIPLGTFVSITGVSGSGKSSLIIDILSKSLSKHFYRAKEEPGDHKEIKGIEHIDKVISIDQTPIGRTPRSNPATYTNVFTAIRDLFTAQPEAKMRGFNAGMFSFNVKGGGRCEACSGEGYKRIPMQFLADVFVECNDCHGARYNKEALDIHYRGKNIADVLSLTVEDAYVFFRDVSAISEKLNVLRDVGLGYLHLGQPATQLSGGEAQRIKLATELSRRSTGKTLYILDEPTTGLHFEDIKRLLHILSQLVDKGNTVITIEHNLDVIKCSDWVIDLGPEGGTKGGELVAEGNPREIVKSPRSFTGKYLKELIK
ncbi:MAG: excinuclease ABC subunit A [Candidatus Magasanikbacteria bacterium RIFCSPHIGHO2_02_FULL_41_13]|uniref:UvrABC system protein A n=1 Tax=Candidatus Magasanikbacteria bacterium RIFCSPHIGHO2_02_FULL_41_13 TaxID=1798676 RepID=A0A1F6M2Q8_9BACT|nr:MAG: excinuclease ABC subunit A [Candidatus Magasanikbacteria bacterium RIFCSPHIGHO2_02_FULL_41_13]